MDPSRAFRALFDFFLFIVFPLVAFGGGYKATDWVFRTRSIPYPFECFGVAVGLGFFFWTLAAAVWWKRISK